MTPEDARKAILGELCADWKRWGKKASSDREALQRQLKIPPTPFSEVIQALVLGGSLAYVQGKPTSVRLDHGGEAYCEREGLA